MRMALLITAVALGMSASAMAETLTNQSIIALTAAGVDQDTILAKIQGSDSSFDVSTDQIIALRRQGVSSAVIRAMVAATSKARSGPTGSTRVPSEIPGRTGEPNIAVQRPAGIYLVQGSQLNRIEPNVSGQTKTGGFLGSALTYGIAKISTKVVLQGENARIRTSEQSPTFYFYLPAATTRGITGSFDEQSSVAPDSPNQFSLIRLTKKSGFREARIGRGNVTGFQAGVVDKDRVNFTFDEVRPGIFLVKPANLPVGEYAFVMIGSGGASVAKFFDFSVQ